VNYVKGICWHMNYFVVSIQNFGNTISFMCLYRHLTGEKPFCPYERLQQSLFFTGFKATAEHSFIFVLLLFLLLFDGR
jgi:DNA-binding helix-hairpin-helix protein with protein kinase domain